VKAITSLGEAIEDKCAEAAFFLEMMGKYEASYRGSNSLITHRTRGAVITQIATSRSLTTKNRRKPLWTMRA